jgi:clan AA aspartic protease (TIGR02281 family)
MMNVDPESRITISARRRASVGSRIVAIAVLLIGAAAAALGYYFVFDDGYLRAVAGRSVYSDLYASLNMAPLPARVEAEVSGDLAVLQKEHCDQVAMTRLTDGLEKLDHTRDAAHALLAFGKQCGNKNGYIYQAGSLLYGLSDYRESAEIADYLVKEWPEILQFHFLKAQVLTDTGAYAQAIPEYADTIELAPDRKTLTEEVFLGMAKTYAKLGSSCKAGSVIQMWISIDPVKRDTPGATKLLSDYLSREHCNADYATGSDSFPRSGKTVILLKAAINGVDGRFIVDTGASFVTLSDEFARKVGFHNDLSDIVRLQTANGSRTARLGTADVIKVGRVAAADVAVASLSGEDAAPFGAGVDGVLGMSFLARFTLTLSANTISLRPAYSK